MAVEATSNVSSVSYVSQGSGQSQSVSKSVESAPKAEPKEVSALETVATAKNAVEAAEMSAEASEKRAEGQASQSSIREAVSKINSVGSNAEAVFGIHEETNRITIKMVDKETKEVIKEFPAEKTLDLIAKAWEMAGILVDERR